MSIKIPHPIITNTCFGCRKSLSSSPLIASVSGHHHYHIQCLRCCECQQILFEERTCFLKNGQIYCRSDYESLMAKKLIVKCTKCQRWIGPSDWVRKAGNNVYHLACFACDLCHRQLSTGEQFTIDTTTSSSTTLDADEDMEQRQQLLCRLHFAINKDPSDDTNSNDNSSEDGSMSNGGINGLNGSSKSSKTKRVRTTFTEEQLQILQANFTIDSNPDGQDLERIATLTGLSKRVTQVWFQNSRARQKKYMNKSRSGGPIVNGTNGSNGMSGNQSMNGTTRSGSTSSDVWRCDGSNNSNDEDTWITNNNHCSEED